MKPICGQNDLTRFAPEITGAIGTIDIAHPAGTFAPSPASVIAVQAIADNRRLLNGTGIDWGCGTGCMTIAAARVPAVGRVIGLDIVAANVECARSNAALNGVAEKTEFIVADSYSPASGDDCRRLELLRGRVDFIVANPPASSGDDGFRYRRVVLEGAPQFLAPGGIVFLNISWQYGPQRIARLVAEVPAFRHRGAIASTDWVPFDLGRPDLLECLEEYAMEESRGGLEYSFRLADAAGAKTMNARAALDRFHGTGTSPLSKWQTHLFEFGGS